jgi:type I restriction enzyme, S subunit
MSWGTKPLASVTRRIGGGTPSRENKAYWGGDIPWFTVADLLDVEDIQCLSDSREGITVAGLTNSAAKLVPEGAIVFSSRVVVGKVGIAKHALATNQDFSSFVPIAGLDRKFLAYFLIKAKSDLRTNQRGATIKGVTTRVLDALQVPLPPLGEQRRIVARILECMKRVEEIKGLSIAQEQATSSLMRSARRELLGAPDHLLDGWTEVRLDSLADVIYGISEAISANRDPSIGPPIIRMANLVRRSP